MREGSELGSMILAADYSYGAVHLVGFALVLAVAAVLAFVAASKRISDKAKDITIACVALFQLGFEVFWRILFLCQGSPFLSLWPYYPCNLAGILLPLALLCRCKKMKECFYLFGFLGGIVTFVYPVGIFDHPYLTFGILKSILQHTGILFIPLFEYVRGTYRPRLENFGYVLLGIVIHIANSYGLSYVFGYEGDYMYVFSGLPFVIPGVPQYVTFSVFALAVLFLSNWAADPKGVSRILREHKAKKGAGGNSLGNNSLVG